VNISLLIKVLSSGFQEAFCFSSMPVTESMKCCFLLCWYTYG